MGQILNDLGGGDAQNPLAQLVQKFPVLQDLTSGKVDGVYALKGFQPPPAMAEATNPQVVDSLGLGIYRPHDPEVAAVLFNPKKISVAQLQKADKADELEKVLKPITQYFDHTAPAAATGQAQTAPMAAVGTPTTNDANPAPNAPSEAPVPVMPRSTFSADAQRMAAQMRLKNLQPVAPTAGPVAAGGQILNGILKPVV
jgi:hypothetical protein